MRVFWKSIWINDLRHMGDDADCIINWSPSIDKCLFCVEFLLAEAVSIACRSNSQRRFLTVLWAVKIMFLEAYFCVFCRCWISETLSSELRSRCPAQPMRAKRTAYPLWYFVIRFLQTLSGEIKLLFGSCWLWKAGQRAVGCQKKFSWRNNFTLCRDNCT